MPHFVGLDASKHKTHICVLDPQGSVVLEGAVASDPGAIAAFLRGRGWRYKRIGMEMWGLASWLYAGLARFGLPIICIEARHAHSVLKQARINKTDRNDARGIAEMMRAGLYKTVHIKSPESQRVRAILATRKILRTKVTDVENGIRGILLSFGRKLAAGRDTTFEKRVRALFNGDRFVEEVLVPLLEARKHLIALFDQMERRTTNLANEDAVCRRLMTAPGVGPITALLFRTGLDEPQRFARSADVGPHFGLTPPSRQSGTSDRKGRISCLGDGAVRSSLYMAARSQMKKCSRKTWLNSWAQAIKARRGANKAIIALARRLATILHRMWTTETDFRWELSKA